MGMDLIGKTLDEVDKLQIRYVVEYEVINGEYVSQQIEEVFEDDTYYLTISNNIVIKSLYSGFINDLFN